MSLPLDPQTLPIAATGFPAPIERHWDTLCRNSLGQLVDGNGVVVAVEAGAITGDGTARFKTSLRVGSGSVALGALDTTDGVVIADGVLAALFSSDRANNARWFAWYENGTIRLTSQQGGDIWIVDPATGVFSLPAWTVVSAFTNSWVDATATSGMSTVRYRKDLFGDVRLWGSLKSGVLGAAAFTLPVGFRPISTTYERALDLSNNASVRVDVQAGGAVVPQTGSNVTALAFNVTFPTV